MGTPGTREFNDATNERDAFLAGMLARVHDAEQRRNIDRARRLLSRPELLALVADSLPVKDRPSKGSLADEIGIDPEKIPALLSEAKQKALPKEPARRENLTNGSTTENDFSALAIDPEQAAADLKKMREDNDFGWFCIERIAELNKKQKPYRIVGTDIRLGERYLELLQLLYERHPHYVDKNEIAQKFYNGSRDAANTLIRGVCEVIENFAALQGTEARNIICNLARYIRFIKLGQDPSIEPQEHSAAALPQPEKPQPVFNITGQPEETDITWARASIADQDVIDKALTLLNRGQFLVHMAALLPARLSLEDQAKQFDLPAEQIPGLRAQARKLLNGETLANDVPVPTSAGIAILSEPNIEQEIEKILSTLNRRQPDIQRALTKLRPFACYIYLSFSYVKGTSFESLAKQLQMKPEAVQKVFLWAECVVEMPEAMDYGWFSVENCPETHGISIRQRFKNSQIYAEPQVFKLLDVLFKKNALVSYQTLAQELLINTSQVFPLILLLQKKISAFYRSQKLNPIRIILDAPDQGILFIKKEPDSPDKFVTATAINIESGYRRRTSTSDLFNSAAERPEDLQSRGVSKDHALTRDEFKLICRYWLSQGVVHKTSNLTRYPDTTHLSEPQARDLLISGKAKLWAKHPGDARIRRWAVRL